MMSKLVLLVVLYAGPSIAALLLVLIGRALARTRAEVVGTAAIAGLLVLVHVAELAYLADMSSLWSGGSDGLDPLVLAGSALALAAGVAVIAFVRRRLPASGLSGDAR